MTQTRKSLGWWQWETLLVTMGGYALYYIIRKNFSLAMPLLRDLGISKVQLGVFLTVGGILYGLARFTNGILTDRNSARKVMAAGLFICAVVNFIFGVSDFISMGQAAPKLVREVAEVAAPAGTVPFSPVKDENVPGGEALRSGEIAHGQSSSYAGTVVGPSELSFKWRTSCEKDPGGKFACDHAELVVDGKVLRSRDGVTGWKEEAVPIDGEGVHAVEWRYVKDGAGNAGEDGAWIVGHRYSFAAAAALVWTMFILYVLNSYFQGMGVGPCVKTLPQWFPPNQLATKQAIWNLSHSIGAGGGFALLGWWLIPHFHAWRLCFLVPAGIAMAGAVGIFLAMKDSPEDVGLPPLPDRKVTVVKTKEESAAYKAFVRDHVLKNPYIWILAVSNFFMNTVRLAALDWGPTFLMESKGLSFAASATLCFVFEIIGGNLGMLVAGWVSDHVFGSRTHRTCVFCFFGIALAVAAFWAVPASAPFALKLIPFALIGFFVYGPQALLGISSTQQATPRAAAAAGGILGVLGYLATIVSGVGLGWMSEAWGWDAAFATILVCALLGGLTVLMMWKAPAEQVQET
jgi:OPA family glycerol-3-phosphate transporter-like MFS transporter/OPA family sugar phosphate sensor protein UhpC-like MFS transporter